MARIAFIDTEIEPKTGKVLDIGGVREDGVCFHGNSVADFTGFLKGADFVCGHNIIDHDLKYVRDAVKAAGVAEGNAVDTLWLSPLLFPKKPYHSLVKDDKLQSDDFNNPLNDSKKAKILFDDEVSAFSALDGELKEIYFRLLGGSREFGAFFRVVGYDGSGSRGHSKELQDHVKERQEGTMSRLRKGLMSIFRSEGSSEAENAAAAETAGLIRARFQGKICSNADIEGMVRKWPVALAYCLALTDVLDSDGHVRSVTPRWVLHNCPEVETLMFRLRSSPCLEGCPYCDKALDIHAGLKRWFGFSSFREYAGEPLQENAVRAAVENRSLLAVFPTGGGKSLTFQLPALMAGENTGGLTVVISPLQSLMKDQVDNLEKKEIVEAVTINGLLDPIERAKSIERVEDGSASLLYIAPESLRSKTVERLLLGRKIVRFVIDEAHCFSAWGQDFRVDYLYIADFIKSLQQKKNLQESIPVSCFTATAKPKVIEDICRYFKDRLSLELKLFSTGVSRNNLHYKVLPEADEESKYQTLRRLIEERTCPVIVYVSRTGKAESLAARLAKDGFAARAYHGKMEPDEKTANQDSFMRGDTRIIVATSAFGMGVDKSDVGLVVHYQISDSLENYVQEAGRAGRDEHINADCYVLFNEEDLSKHFILLNQTKLTIKEIQQVWTAVKSLTKIRSKVSNSALEIARMAGWDDGMKDIETRVRTAIASLEQAGYLKRGQNMPRVYATGILTDTAQEAIDRINASSRFEENEKVQAIRIIRRLISSRSVKRAQGDEAESRVDYISDHLGIPKEQVIHIIGLLREEKILADTKDLTAYIRKGENSGRAMHIVRDFNVTENFLLSHIDEHGVLLDLKDLNGEAERSECKGVDLNRMKIILNFWSIKKWIEKSPHGNSKNYYKARCLVQKDKLEERMRARQELAVFITDYLYERMSVQSGVPDGGIQAAEGDAVPVEFSVLGLKEAYENSLSVFSPAVSSADVEDALFYLSRIGAIKIEGGFLVIYNGMSIERLVKDNSRRYKLDDYHNLSEFYKNKIQQIHIVGEYARKMIEDYEGALQFVEDYFSLNYPSFLRKYFKGRQDEITNTVTPSKFRQLFGDLSPAQLKIINDRNAKYIVVAAGPGSGKTKLLVHKLASLLMMEDVKHEQLLMLTFSRAAAMEFRRRLYDLIGNAASYVEIKTFHSYCFDLLGKIGTLEQSEKVVAAAVEKIAAGEVDVSRITKTVLVIDEAQDMDENEFNLVKALMDRNEDMRVIAVGDDDQNIYEFRGSSSRYMEEILTMDGAVKYELSENFRSRRNLVAFSNAFAASITHRLKKYPIVSRREEDGSLAVVRYCSQNLELPLVKAIAATGLSGTTAVLVHTNNEALIVTGLLLKNGVPARLIQSNEDFSLASLAEISYFMGIAGIHRDGPVVSSEDWAAARRCMSDRFARSSMLGVCLDIVDNFEASCPDDTSGSGQGKVIYKSDFELFLRESSLEDFTRADTSAILVSTIHKVKGKEFDNVFLMLDDFKCSGDKERRQLYVALTRAKSNLSIHINTPLLDNITAPGLKRLADSNVYEKADEMTLLLTMRDVNLGSFEYSQKVVHSLVSGDALQFGTDRLLANGKFLMFFSDRFKQNLSSLQSQGYSIDSAEAAFILWWKAKDAPSPILIVLPKIHLVRLSHGGSRHAENQP